MLLLLLLLTTGTGTSADTRSYTAANSDIATDTMTATAINTVDGAENVC